MSAVPENLPCLSCPHHSVCCRWGTYLNKDEGRELLKEFGPAYIFWDADKMEYRTQVWNGRCVFFKTGQCSIHGHPNYPQRCREFPRMESASRIMPETTITLCPEIKSHNITP